MPNHPDRLVALQGASNFRDLGGYPGLHGRPVRWRRLFRAPHLADLTVADEALLAGLGVARAFDFRGLDERAATPYSVPGISQHSYRVICGTTGSGKTRLLQALAAEGAQVLDLEALANHRSSVLGLIPGQPQPTQKAFDSRIWAALRSFDAARPVYIESESKKVGNVAVPEGLIAAMRASPCLQLDLPEDERVALLLEDYDFFVKDIEFFCDRLGALTQARGKETVADWQQRSRSGDVAAVVRELLVTHYDPVYLQSMRRNFTQYASAPVIAPQGRSVAAMTALARQMLAGSTGISLTV